MGGRATEQQCAVIFLSVHTIRHISPPVSLSSKPVCDIVTIALLFWHLGSFVFSCFKLCII